MKKTLYDSLHVPSNASAELIELAYQVRKKRLKDATDHESQNELKFVQEAFAILSDRQQRARYDQSLDSQTPNDDSAIYASNEEVEGSNYSGTMKLLVLATIAVACFLAYQLFIKESRKTGASVRETSTQEKNPKLPLDVRDYRAAPAAVVSRAAELQPQVPAQASGLKNALAGSWIWNSDKITFGLDDRGTYYRDKAVCFRFSYAVKGDVLTETADKSHDCGSGLTASYHVSIAKNNLTMKHTGTSHESEWERSPE